MATTTRKRRTMPQPAAPPAEAPKQTDAAKEAAAQAEQDWLDLVKDATSTGHELAQEYVQDAIRLEADRAGVLAKIADVRDMLRKLDNTDKLNEAQAEFLDVFYPEKERGERRSAEDLEATRRAREAARKNGTAE